MASALFIILNLSIYLRTINIMHLPLHLYDREGLGVYENGAKALVYSIKALSVAQTKGNIETAYKRTFQ